MVPIEVGGKGAIGKSKKQSLHILISCSLFAVKENKERFNCKDN